MIRISFVYLAEGLKIYHYLFIYIKFTLISTYFLLGRQYSQQSLQQKLFLPIESAETQD